MAAGSGQIWKDIRRNRPVKYDNMIRQNAEADMTSFRRVPYYLQNRKALQCREFNFSYPCSIGDEIYEIYAGKIYPLKVTGFYITRYGKYVIVKDKPEAHETQIALQNIYLSKEEAQCYLERSK